jgi:hypothetical protein
MNKSDKVYYESLKSLRNAGWNAKKEDAIRFNSGSETAKHVHAKTACARVLKKNGYRVGSEVKHAERGEVDVIGVPTDGDRKPIAAEVETSPTEDVIGDKLERYYEGTPFREVFVVNVSELPLNILDMEEQIAAELGMEV